MNKEVRFYLDEHVPGALLTALRRHGHDVQSAVEAILDGEEDELHLAHAATEGRVVVMQDRDFFRLHAEGRRHAGIIYFPQHTAVRLMIDAVLLVAGVMTAEELVNQVQYL